MTIRGIESTKRKGGGCHLHSSSLHFHHATRDFVCKITKSIKLYKSIKVKLIWKWCEGHKVPAFLKDADLNVSSIGIAR